VLAAAVAIAGWLLLLFVKGTVVLIGYALGIAIVGQPQASQCRDSPPRGRGRATGHADPV